MNPGLCLALCLFAASAQLRAQDAEFDHLIELQLQPQGGVIEIRDRVRVGGIGHYRFQLADWIDSIEVRAGDRRLSPRRDGVDLVVDLPAESVQYLDFHLRGLLPARDPANARALSSSGGNDGAYLSAQDHWIPRPRDQASSYRLDVIVPIAQRAVAIGRLVDERMDDQFYRARFESGYASEPPYLFAGPYQVRERLAEGLRLRTYFHAGLDGHADAYLDAVHQYIQRYRDEIGDYPYSGFSVVSAPLPVGLGFPGLTYVDRRIVPLPFMRTRSLAHEVLHNWWGNAVAIDYASGNWAEGLTTYMADYALELDKGESEARSMRVKWLRDYAALPAERDQPVRAFRSKRHQADQVIGYNKVAFIFHMLSLEIGRPAFADGLRRLWAQNRFGVAGWEQLGEAFEQAAGRDLGWFFEQWLERRGAPRLSLGEHSVTPVDEGYLTRITLFQPQAGYRLRLPVLLVTEDGDEQRREILAEATGTHIEWVTPSKPRYIHFDPDSDVFRRLQANETPPILRDVTLDPAALTVIASDDPVVEGSARELAARLFDAQPRIVDMNTALSARRPLLLVATRDRLPGLLAQLSLQPPSALPGDPHTAAAWSARLANGSPVLVVSAENGQELKALSRPLPHYGGQSYVLFERGRALRRGIWPIERGALYRDLANGA